MKLVIFISLLLVFPLCSSGFEKDDEVTQVSQHSSDKVAYSVERTIDYPGPFDPTPIITPIVPFTDPPPPPPPRPTKNDILQ
ncbi:uncharacterized protein LOC108850799 [Raphanus sativus]|uniref:Uncharacterized protein LOC108850799 n=1 Tax=Raphanus sativus TaxID=3726 RepID=A0A6J0N549_RAPSA|nr:uncharacterized protein LOC108850799 [Raphanus sativus]